jgi:hypothetical protein
MMIQRLLLAAVLVLSGGVASAQFASGSTAPDFRFNVGIYGGIAPTTRVYRTVDYSADNKSLPSMWGIIGHYNFTDRFQVGLDINTQSEWTSLGTTTIYGTGGQTLGQPGVRYVYSERTWTLQARANAMIPMYNKMREVRSSFYYGAAVGAIFTVNDGQSDYRQFNEQVGEEYRYVSEYRYEPAAGYTFGIQAGMEWWVLNRIGINAEFAPRFNHLNMVDNRIASRNGPFDVFTFPVVAGIRYRFGMGGWAH